MRPLVHAREGIWRLISKSGRFVISVKEPENPSCH